MKTHWTGLTRRLFPAFGHPSYTRLVDWHAGELDAPLLASTTRHVLTCPRCQRETARIRRVLDRSSAALDRAAAPPPAERAVERLPGLLRNRALVRATHDRYRQERALRLVAVLRPYLGQPPMSLLERAESGDFLSEVRRLADVFLGKQAAGALIDLPDLEAGESEGLG